MKALGDVSGDVLVLYGDVPLITTATLQEFYDHHKRGDFAATVLAFAPPDPHGYGRILQNPDGTLAGIVEEADANDTQKMIRLCNAGPMLVKANGLQQTLAKLEPRNAQGELYLVDVPKLLQQDGQASGVIRGEFFELRGINDRAQLAELEMGWQHRFRYDLMQSGVTLQDPNTTYFSFDTVIENDVTVGANVVFGAGVTIRSNVTIKPFCHFEGVEVKPGATVGPFARLRPGTIIGEDVHIGNFVEVKNSTLGTGTKVNHLSYIGDSDIGSKTNVGAGVITVNYDGFDKHRTTIGDNVMVGCNANLVAPLNIGDGAYIAAGATLTEDVPNDALAIARPQADIKQGWAKDYRARKTKSK
jgi:bifunctional UDP-N-acetylglucosamine pyrophosphorylase/glucosamine-1-phosphate N-acetyltransferase